MSQRSRFANQRGLFVPLLGIGILLLIGILAFAVDMPQKEVISQEMRRALDSAALGGAQALNGTVAGIRQAVSQVDHMILANQVGGKALDLANQEYEIEVGFYSFPDKQFLPLDAGEAYRSPLQGPVPPTEYLGVPVAAMANALRVTGQMTAPSIFSGVFGLSSMGAVKSKAVAVANRKSKVCAFPMAIPFCSLFLNQDPNIPIVDSGRPEKVRTTEYEAHRHCKRPVFFTEANYEFEGEAGSEFGKARRGGWFRAHTYARPEKVDFPGSNLCGEAPGATGNNCLNRPIMGVFISPRRVDGDSNGALTSKDPALDADSGNDFFDTRQLRGLLEGMQANSEAPPNQVPCINFEIGEKVATLDDYNKTGVSKPPEGTSILVDDLAGSGGSSSLGMGPSGSASSAQAAIEANELDQIFVNFFSGAGSRSFVQAFGNSLTGIPPVKDNFPFIRARGRSRAIGIGAKRVVSAPMKKWQWSNPLCHYHGWKMNDLVNARSVPVVVPVIMPEETNSQIPRNYCHAENDVGSDPYVKSVAPSSYTNPRVVGFVKVDLIDFNFRWLKNKGLKFDQAPYQELFNGSLFSRLNDQVVDGLPAAGLIPGVSDGSAVENDEDLSFDGDSGTGNSGNSGQGNGSSSAVNSGSGSSSASGGGPPSPVPSDEDE